MKQVLIRKGQAVLTDVPAPEVSAGRVLVLVEYSCISVGTEMADLKTSGTPIYMRVREQHDNVRRVMEIYDQLLGLVHAGSTVT